MKNIGSQPIVDDMGTASTEEEPPSKTKKPKVLPPHGRRLRRRRQDLDLSMDKLAMAANEPSVYKEMVKRLEWGVMKPQALKFPQLVGLARALEWSMVELADALDLRLPASFLAKGETSLSNSTYVNENVLEIVLNAFDFGNNVWMSTRIAKYHLPANSNPLNTFLTTVEPAMLATPELHDKLREGAVLAFGTGYSPDDGNTVFVHDEAQDVRAVATYSPTGEYAVMSLDRKRVFKLEGAKVTGVLKSHTHQTNTL